MTRLFSLAILTIVPIALLWGTYRFVLARSKSALWFNRAFLLAGVVGIVIVSLASEYAVFSAFSGLSESTTDDASVAVINSQQGIPIGITSSAGLQMSLTHTAGNFDYARLVTISYISGVAVALFLTLCNLVQLWNTRRRCTLSHFVGVPVWISPDRDVMPMNIGRTIIINRFDYQVNAEMIIAHEQAHMSLGHTYDLIFMQLLAIICWFNPFIWLLRRELKRLHEFQADETVINMGVNRTEYQTMLIKTASSRTTSGLSIENNLNYKNLKNRIIMMNLKAESWVRKLWLVPALIICCAIWASCYSSAEKLAASVSSSDNVYKTFAEYRAAGTTETAAKDSVREKFAYDGQTQFVIYGVDVTSPEFKEWDFILIHDLSASNLPDSYYDGYSMPLTKAVVAIRKEVIRHLAPRASKFIIDGKEVADEEFDRLSGGDIQRVTLNGYSIEIAKRLWPRNEHNPEIRMAVDNETRLMRDLFGDEAFAD